MKKIFSLMSLVSLFLVLSTSSVFSYINFMGFNAFVSADMLQDISFNGGLVENAKIQLKADGSVSTMSYKVKCNYDNWNLSVMSDSTTRNGLFNPSRNHTIKLYVAGDTVVNASPTTLLPVKDSNTSVQTGVFSGATGADYILSFKPDATDFNNKRYGYYNVYLQLKLTDIY